MIKNFLSTFFLFSVYTLSAQTVITSDTLKAAAGATISTTETLTPATQADSSRSTKAATPATATTSTTETVTPSIPADTAKLTVLPTQTVQATQPNIKHKPKAKHSVKKDNEEIATLYREPFDKKKEIVLENKRFRIYNNYLTAGAGKCYNSGWKDWELSTAFDYNFHVKKNHFQFGAMLAGPGLRDNNCIQMHMGWGYRFERTNYHWAAYGGLSYSDGYYLRGQDIDSIYKVKFSAIGVYANLQCYYKLKFDYGLGFSAFLDANSKQTISGIRIELFFSGSYKGFKKINYAKEEEKY
jgi:hypothetical protein